MGRAAVKCGRYCIQPASRQETPNSFFRVEYPLFFCQPVVGESKQPPMMSHRRLLRCWQSVYKPGSVGPLACSGRSFLYEHGRPCSLAAYPRCLDRGGRLSPHIWPCSSRGLPCRSCCHERGGLLPHRFTLATRRWRSFFCGTFRHIGSSRHLCPGVTWQPVHWSPDFPRIYVS